MSKREGDQRVILDFCGGRVTYDLSAYPEAKFFGSTRCCSCGKELKDYLLAEHVDSLSWLEECPLCHAKNRYFTG